MDDGEIFKIECHDGTWSFDTIDMTAFKAGRRLGQSATPVIANFAAADGVADMKFWHQRLGHLCPEYVRLTADRDLMKGMMVRKREHQRCEVCCVSKQKAKPRQKKLQGRVSAPNEMIYADLLFLGQHNRTRFSAVLVTIDVFTKFVFVFLLKSKTQDEVNMRIQQYIRWAERQTCRVGVEGDDVTHQVKTILTDRDTEFVNHASEQWFAGAGIVHVKAGPKRSHLNPCARVHQTLVEMTAAYIKNRVYFRGTNVSPFQLMFGFRPDILP
ncbi:TPA: hypothetical protein N0F65_010200 [Lagenidium giganteum]|uniref:Integrase catalytic domain-containing protein n=1 Tax=Lagenidium giganteum TaxID=4803 RepID=A0AAV2YI31_9STRA|nr:TPA: hypothetical protein N0F65_010200 [Lagenidium giganteum]